MRKAIEIRCELVFLSYRNQSITHGIRQIYLEAHHGICLYHFEKNLKQIHAKSMAINLFQTAVGSYKHEEFNQLMSHTKVLTRIYTLI